ncbi:MAG: hypothetical protein KF708_20045 [Pirellulales bacterium]|nr:hypothetical protein [Pirellulales bacterium]
MDKVKQFLAVLKQRHFWVLCGVILILAFVSWSSAKSYFSAEYTKQKGTVESKFSALRTISGTANHPNEGFATRGTTIANDLKQKTYAAWEQVYNAQKSQLTWIADPQAIGEVPPLPEGDPSAPPVGAEKQLVQRFYDYYSQNYVPQLFSPQVINLLRVTPATDTQPARVEGVIQWDETQRNSIQQRYNWSKIPSSKAIRFAQEDYWIYRAVLQAINSANGNAQASHEAAVKQIRVLKIAQDALATVSSSAISVANVTADQVVREVTDEPKAPGVDATDEELEANRYASPAVSGGEGGGGSSQYKLVPVYLELLVRESKVPDVLAACANATLPLEVRKCTLQQATSAKPAGGNAPAASVAPGARAEGGAGAANTAGLADDGDVVVSLYGVIYLYTPPSRTALNMQEESPADEAPVEEGV